MFIGHWYIFDEVSVQIFCLVLTGLFSHCMIQESILLICDISFVLLSVSEQNFSIFDKI